MDKPQIIEFLKNIELFKELSENEIDILADKFSIANYFNGDFLFKENQEREKVFIIYSGRVEILKSIQAAKMKQIGLFYNGEFISEGAMLDKHPHSTSARCIETSIVLELERKNINILFNEYPAITAKLLASISRVMSRRLRIAASRSAGPFQQYLSGKTRAEHDLLGNREVPFDSYYGIQTLRAMENFNITGITISHHKSLIIALAQVKKAAALANHKLGSLDDKIKDAICQACDEIIVGKFHTHFQVDLIQGGAGTSTNMNANEVIANRALEIMGYQKGEYEHCHPNNHVNMSQSTNDVYPTSLLITMIYENEKLKASLVELIQSFRKKGEEFKHILKMGRTQLQDAVPMTLGQEFEAYAVTLEEEIQRLTDNAKLFHEINMGATAIGTGITAEPKYAGYVTTFLCEVTGLPLVSATNLVEATQDTGAFVIYSSAVKRLAVKLSKISNDLRLLSSGPRAGLAEINLPAMQPGSSIMPGKVNPVIPEVVNQIAFKVIGNDLTVTLAAEAGQLQLNVMEPVIAQSILESIEILCNGIVTLKEKCIDGITANEDKCRYYVQNSIGLVTALVPLIGYEECSKVAKEAFATNKGVYELVLEHNYLSKEKLDEFLKPENMIQPIHIEK